MKNTTPQPQSWVNRTFDIPSQYVLLQIVGFSWLYVHLKNRHDKQIDCRNEEDKSTVILPYFCHPHFVLRIFR